MTPFSGRETSQPQCVHLDEKAAHSVSETLVTIMGFFASNGLGSFFDPPTLVNSTYAGSVKLIDTGSKATGTDFPLAVNRVTIIGPMTAAAMALFPAWADKFPARLRYILHTKVLSLMDEINYFNKVNKPI